MPNQEKFLQGTSVESRSPIAAAGGICLWHVWKARVTGFWSSRSWGLETAARTNTFLQLEHGVLQAESGMSLPQKSDAVSLSSICLWQVLKAVFLFQRTQHLGTCLLVRASNWSLKSSFSSSSDGLASLFPRNLLAQIYIVPAGA